MQDFMCEHTQRIQFADVGERKDQLLDTGRFDLGYANSIYHVFHKLARFGQWGRNCGMAKERMLLIVITYDNAVGRHIR